MFMNMHENLHKPEALGLGQDVVKEEIKGIFWSQSIQSFMRKEL